MGTLKVHPSSNGVFVDIGSQRPLFIPPFCTKEEPYGKGFSFSISMWYRQTSNHPQEDLAKFGYRTLFFTKILYKCWNNKFLGQKNEKKKKNPPKKEHSL